MQKNFGTRNPLPSFQSHKDNFIKLLFQFELHKILSLINIIVNRTHQSNVCNLKVLINQ